MLNLILAIISIAVIFIYSLGLLINLCINVYYDTCTNRGGKCDFYIFLSWFSTRKILNENKKYSFCTKNTKISINLISMTIIIFALFYLNENGVININFIITPLKQFDNWINDTFQKLFVNPINSLIVSIYERF